MKNKKNRKAAYIELTIVCIVLAILIYVFNLPSHIYIVLVLAALVNLIAILIRYEK
ncbi:hypothetical protein [Bacillus badius]|uniref:hypothetical protein n=1 Tax=Bacillus badius TaxID=1455 RepID=UPI0012E0423E|nr:hypothetical protein [Bacillus badius]